MTSPERSYEDAVRETAVALPPITQETRDQLSVLLRGARRPDETRRAS